MGRQPVLDVIKNTKHSLNLIIYGITDKTLLTALVQQKYAGRSIKVILEDEPYKAKTQNHKAIHAIKSAGIDWQGNIQPYRLIHQKSLISDNDKALVMTFNFTRSAFNKQRNFALLIDDKKQARAINRLFISDWNHKPATNIPKEFIVSPDNSRHALIQLIKDAKQEIDIYAQGLNDYELIGELAKAAKRGVKINILTSANTRRKQYNFMRKAGINIRKSDNLYIHAKAWIIDNATAIVGSLNLTKSAFDDNRELSIVTHEKKITTKLKSTFKGDWSEAVSVT